jgi:pimeloyl-ACP methyl ester carboxylesterase
VFVHGALHDHSAGRCWRAGSPTTAGPCWRSTCPATARSEGPPLPSVEACADWLLALLDAAGVRRPRLVGHSMGSLIALEAAARAPERATRLVMIGTAYPMKVSEALLATAREEAAEGHRHGQRLLDFAHAAKPSYPGPGMWLHGSNRALMRRTLRGGGTVDGRNLFEHDFRVCDAYAGGLEAAARVRCPATMILGRSTR